MPSLRIALLALLIGLMGLPAAAADATDPQHVVQSHEMSGYAFRAAFPQDWNARYVGKTTFLVTSPHETLRDPHIDVAFSATRLPMKTIEEHGYKPGGELTLEAFDKQLGVPTYYRNQRSFPEKDVTVGGMRMRRYGFAAGAYKDATGVIVAARATPEMYLYTVLTPELVRINIRIQAGGQGEDRAHHLLKAAPLLDRIVASVTIRKTAELSAEQRAALPTFHGSDWFRISQRRDYSLDLDTSFLAPAGWQVGVVQSTTAGRGREQGAYALQLLPPKKSESDTLHVALLIVDGMPVRPQVKSAYLATLDPRVKKVLPKGKLVSTEEIDHPGLRSLARMATRRGSSTQRTVVRTYKETKPGGRSVVLKAYTAGGLTAAVTLILLGDETGFDAFEASFADILQTLRVDVSPPFFN